MNILTVVRICLLAVSLGSGPGAAGQDQKAFVPLVLRQATVLFTPKEFFISEVSDERADRQAVAYLVAPAAKEAAPALQPLDFQGGTLAAVRQFIRQGVPTDQSLRPVKVRLKEWRLTEKRTADGRVEGQVAVSLVFEVHRQGKTVFTMPYKGSARYLRMPNQVSVVEPTLRQALVHGLEYLNTWMNREADKTEKLATGLRVTFKEAPFREDPDTLFYHPKRPLRWEDFRAQPKASPFAAAVFPSFSYEGSTRVENGILHIELAMNVFVVRDASWVRIGRDAYGLNHEQRHFDLVKLIAERFKKQVRTADLTIEDYNSMIQYQFLETWREMTALQEQYDRETRHGLDQAAQQRWNQQIDRDLLDQGAKK